MLGHRDFINFVYKTFRRQSVFVLSWHQKSLSGIIQFDVSSGLGEKIKINFHNFPLLQNL